MWLVPLAWLYVVLMMALVEALSSQGTVLGAVFTFLLYGVLPVGIVMYVLGTPFRRRAARQAQADSDADGDGSGHAPGEPVAAERKEP